MVIKQDFLEMEALIWLNKKSWNESVSLKVGYLMWLGSSSPYPWLIVEENGSQDDDDDECHPARLLLSFYLHGTKIVYIHSRL